MQCEITRICKLAYSDNPVSLNIDGYALDKNVIRILNFTRHFAAWNLSTAMEETVKQELSVFLDFQISAESLR